MSLCPILRSNIQNNESVVSLTEILASHYAERERLLRELGYIRATDALQYPNLEFISHFGQYIHLGNTSDRDDCLCNISRNHTDRSVLHIDRLFGQGRTGSAYRVSYDGEFYILKIINNVGYKPYVSLVVHRLDEIVPAHVIAEPSLSYNMVKDTNGTYNIVTLEGDQFQNQTLINMILTLIPEIQEGTQYVKQLDAFYCTNNGRYDGYNITEIASLGDIVTLLSLYDNNSIPLSDSLIMRMYEHVLTPLSILKSPRYGFCHNDLKIRNVFVSGTVQNPQFLIADFDKSSIFWNGIRVANAIRQSSIFGSLSSLSLNYYFNGYRTFDRDGATYYRLNRERVEGENSGLIMYTWIPMFMAHDTYTFTVSLLLEPIFWNAFSVGIDINPNISTSLSFSFPRFLRLLTLLFEDQTATLLQQIENLQYQYTTERDDTRKREMLRHFYSMNFINNILSTYDLRINVDSVYEMFGLQIQRTER